MNNKDKIIRYFQEFQDGIVVAANSIYEKEFSRMSEAAFFKALERLVNEGFLERLYKGIYAYNIGETYQEKQNALLNFYFGEDNDNGMYVGERLYQKYSLISKDSVNELENEKISIFSNCVLYDKCNILNIRIKRVSIELNYENTRVIEALEILEHYDDIRDLNKQKFAKFARQFAKGYEDAVTVNVINNLKYKKRTIAFMKKILDMYKIKNSLSGFISYATDYRLPSVARVSR